MRKNLIILLFAILALAQIASPLSMIVKRELVLKNGIPFRFKTIPQDPADPFRGRYVALRIEASNVPKPLNPIILKIKNFAIAINFLS